MVLVCHLISRVHMLKGLCEFMDGNSSRRVTTLPRLVAIGLVQVQI